MQSLADQVVVIGRGRLIADCSLEEFLRGHALETVQVRTEDPATLAAAITRAGGVVENRDGDLLTVSACTRHQIAELAATHHCLVSELFATTATLEDAFLRASVGGVEFDTSVTARREVLR